MSASEWDLQEVKQLKWRQLIQYNVIMLFFFLVAVYYVKVVGTAFFLVIFFCLVVWGFFLHALYTLKTGRIIGTKTMKIVHTYDKDFQGEKGWKRKKIIEVALMGIVALVCTVMIGRLHLTDVTLELYSLAPFIGAWVGLNLGEWIRISNL